MLRAEKSESKGGKWREEKECQGDGGQASTEQAAVQQRLQRLGKSQERQRRGTGRAKSCVAVGKRLPGLGRWRGEAAKWNSGEGDGAAKMNPTTVR